MITLTYIYVTVVIQTFEFEGSFTITETNLQVPILLFIPVENILYLQKHFSSFPLKLSFNNRLDLSSADSRFTFEKFPKVLAFRKFSTLSAM